MTLVIEDPLVNDYSDAVLKYLDTKPQELSVYIINPIECADELNFLLNKLYDIFRKISQLKGLDYKFPININFNAEIPPNSYYVSGEGPYGIEINANTTKTNWDIPKSLYTKKFDTVAVGGTFDHLHDGHKILLSLASFLSEQRLIVGVTDAELLKNKKFKHQLESFETRVENTAKFVKFLNVPRFEIFKIVDVCGPTGYIKDIDCLVLSQESIGGGEFVNNYRKSIGFKPLEIFTIDLIGGENKLSSTHLRELDSIGDNR